MNKAIQIGYNDVFEKKCRYASEGGFKAIAVNFTEMLGKTEYEWEKAVEDIQRILDDNNLKCVQSHPYYYDLRISSEIVEEECELAIKRAIVASGKLGADWCALHPRSSVSSGFCTSKALEDNKKAFSEYLEYAHKYNTGLAAENLPIFNGIIPIMPFYSSNYEDLCVLVDSINDERMGICWDTGHANMMNYNQAEAIKFLGERIKCTHIHNNFKKTDLHLTPDNGDIPWDEVMRAMKVIEYDGYFTLETHCIYAEDGMLKSFARYNYECLEYLERVIQDTKI